MCLLIAKPAGTVIPTSHLENGFDTNADGAGFAYVHKGRVEIRKGFMDFKTFLAAYRAVPTDSAHIVHFRWSTHGTISRKNCHPFRLPDGSAMAHNGIINVKTTGDRSDTRAFVNDWLAPNIRKFGPGIILDAAYQMFVEAFIGGSKLAFLNVDGEITIYNEDMGKWDNGVWYSNDGYKSAPRWTRYRQAGVTATGKPYAWKSASESQWDGDGGSGNGLWTPGADGPTRIAQPGATKLFTDADIARMYGEEIAGRDRDALAGRTLPNQSDAAGLSTEDYAVERAKFIAEAVSGGLSEGEAIRMLDEQLDAQIAADEAAEAEAMARAEAVDECMDCGPGCNGMMVAGRLYTEADLDALTDDQWKALLEADEIEAAVREQKRRDNLNRFFGQADTADRDMRDAADEADLIVRGYLQ